MVYDKDKDRLGLGEEIKPNIPQDSSYMWRDPWEGMYDERKEDNKQIMDFGVNQNNPIFRTDSEAEKYTDTTDVDVRQPMSWLDLSNQYMNRQGISGYGLPARAYRTGQFLNGVKNNERGAGLGLAASGLGLGLGLARQIASGYSGENQYNRTMSDYYTNQGRQMRNPYQTQRGDGRRTVYGDGYGEDGGAYYNDGGTPFLQQVETAYGEPQTTYADIDTPSLKNHTVMKGETLGSIARRYNINYRDIAKYNKIEDANKINAGQKLVIPPSLGGEIPYAPNKDSKQYKIKKGDTLTKISKETGVKIADIKRLNGIQDINKINAGDYIDIPLTTTRQLVQETRRGTSSGKDKDNFKEDVKQEVEANPPLTDAEVNALSHQLRGISPPKRNIPDFFVQNYGFIDNDDSRLTEAEQAYLFDNMADDNIFQKAYQSLPNFLWNKGASSLPRDSRLRSRRSFKHGGMFNPLSGLPSKEAVATGEYNFGLPAFLEDKANVELEGGEYTKDAAGSVQLVVGEKHEKGGAKMYYKEPVEILSDNLKLGKEGAKDFKDLFGINTKKSDTFATALDKLTSDIGLDDLTKDQKKVYKKMSDQKEVEKNTAAINLQHLSGKAVELEDRRRILEEKRVHGFDALYNTQEQFKKTPKYKIIKAKQDNKLDKEAEKELESYSKYKESIL